MTTKANTIRLPEAGGGIRTHVMREPAQFAKHPRPFTSRTVLAAPHVVADVRAEYTPGVEPPVDWEATMAFRRHLWSYGIGVAEGMDTSERGDGGLTWPQAQELIARGIEEAEAVGGAIVCGAGTDQITSAEPSLNEVIDAYLEQTAFIEGRRGATVIRASHALVAAASSPEDYLHVYGTVLASLERPAIVHWLGTVFDPTLAGYWGHEDVRAAMEVVLEMAHANEDSLRGIKFSLLDEELEKEFRRRVPASIEVFTGDDYGYTQLLLGDGEHHSHGLLGVLDPIAPVASGAFAALDRGEPAEFARIMDTTIPLAVKMFEPPAASYKVGVVFTAWISGHQDHFRMVTGREGMRSLQHLTDLFVLSDSLGLYPDPELAAHRMRILLAAGGVE